MASIKGAVYVPELLFQPCGNKYISKSGGPSKQFAYLIISSGIPIGSVNINISQQSDQLVTKRPLVTRKVQSRVEIHQFRLYL